MITPVAEEEDRWSRNTWTNHSLHTQCLANSVCNVFCFVNSNSIGMRHTFLPSVFFLAI